MNRWKITQNVMPFFQKMRANIVCIPNFPHFVLLLNYFCSNYIPDKPRVFKRCNYIFEYTNLIPVAAFVKYLYKNVKTIFN